jgi:hypothetical protein
MASFLSTMQSTIIVTLTGLVGTLRIFWRIIMSEATPQPRETVNVKRIVNLGEESFLVLKLPRHFEETDIVGPMTIDINPAVGGGGVCCNSLHTT